jgi:predicted transcriptional regulator
MSPTTREQEADDLFSNEIRLLDTLREMGPQSIERLASLSGLNLAQVSESIDRLSRSRTVSLVQNGCGERRVSMTELACWI